MTIELYEGSKSLYLCIVNRQGGCLAARVFDVYDGSQRDGGSDIGTAARELAADPAAWGRWNVGLYPPGIAYEREILSVARLAMHHDAGSWHTDNPNCGPAVRKFKDAYNEAAADVGVPDCEGCRLSGLLEED